MTREYRTAAAFKQALEQRLRTASTSGVDFARRRQLVVFDRFLARIALELGDAVTLKGGLAVELRIERARTTKDVDLRVIPQEPSGRTVQSPIPRAERAEGFVDSVGLDGVVLHPVPSTQARQRPTTVSKAGNPCSLTGISSFGFGRFSGVFGSTLVVSPTLEVCHGPFLVPGSRRRRRRWFRRSALFPCISVLA